MDYKLAASGDEQQETSQQNDKNRSQSATPDYIIGLINHLEAITARTLSEQEMETWIMKLSKYPKWKLSELQEYSGPLNHEVFKYLDSLHRPEPVIEWAKALPEPESDIGKDTIAHIKKLYAFQGALRDKRIMEKAGLVVLNTRYSNRGFARVLMERRFDEINKSA